MSENQPERQDDDTQESAAARPDAATQPPEPDGDTQDAEATREPEPAHVHTSEQSADDARDPRRDPSDYVAGGSEDGS